jgi:hypothetical protein
VCVSLIQQDLFYLTAVSKNLLKAPSTYHRFTNSGNRLNHHLTSPWDNGRKDCGIQNFVLSDILKTSQYALGDFILGKEQANA